MAAYLEFEQKIKRIEEDIENAKIKGDEAAIEILNEDLEKEVAKTYKNLTPYQKLQLARHPDRLYAKDYVRGIMREPYEIHGDRHFRDDSSIVAYIGYIDNVKTMIIGEQKGRGTKNKLKRNFGMPHPEGYRKALRVAKLAEKFGIPILMLVDTPGAYPGIGAEERGQSEAIAKNLQEFSKLKTITISVVIGEGGSGGALAIAVADKLAMMRYSVFSVISPEGCAAILWDDPSKIENATEAMKITAEELYDAKLIDDIVNEPITGAHRDKTQAISELKSYFLKSFGELKKLKLDERLEKRYSKIISYGAFSE